MNYEVLDETFDSKFRIDSVEYRERINVILTARQHHKSYLIRVNEYSSVDKRIRNSARIFTKVNDSTIGEIRYEIQWDACTHDGELCNKKIHGVEVCFDESHYSLQPKLAYPLVLPKVFIELLFTEYKYILVVE